MNTSILQKTYVFDNLQAEDFGIVFRIKSYTVNNTKTMYNLTYTTFVGHLYAAFIHDVYLQKFQLQNYTDMYIADNFQVFNLDYRSTK